MICALGHQKKLHRIIPKGLFILNGKKDVIFYHHFLPKERAENCIGFPDIEHASLPLPTMVWLLESTNEGDLQATSASGRGIADYVQDQKDIRKNAVQAPTPFKRMRFTGGHQVNSEEGDISWT